jgi:enoyl-CoA hydratase
MNYETIILEKKGPIALVILNRPTKKNALSEQLQRELIRACDEVEKDNGLKVMVLTGNAECFSAGADLEDVSKTDDGLPSGPNAIHYVADMTKPTIAAVSGWCVAGGIELALSCDMRVVADNARIGARHIRIGFIGGAGSPTRLVRLIGASNAAKLILTGEMIDGKEAYRLGLANEVFPAEKLMDGALELAGKIASHSLTALRLSKKSVKGAADTPEYESIHHTQGCLLELLASAEYKERIANFLGKG